MDLKTIAGITEQSQTASYVPTVAELDAAIRKVMGADTYAALKNGQVGRTRMHDMACLKAFAANRHDEAAEVLRAMWNELSRTGVYPKASWTGQEDTFD